jgi:translation elongation factor EF-Tu-like GTPase
MRTESEGGRHAPFTEGYAPHLVIDGQTEWLPVRVHICPRPIAPGMTSDVVFQLLYYPKVDYSALKPEVKFVVREGPKTAASGVVVALRTSDGTNEIGAI